MQACIAYSYARIVGFALAGRRQFMPKIASLLIVALRHSRSAILVARFSSRTKRDANGDFLFCGTDEPPVSRPFGTKNSVH